MLPETAIYPERPKSHRIAGSQILRVPTFVQQSDRLQCARATTSRSTSPLTINRPPRARRRIQDQRGEGAVSSCNLHGQVFERSEAGPGDKKTISSAGGAITSPIVKSRAGFVSGASCPGRGPNLCGLLIVRQQPLEWRQVFGRAGHVNISSAVNNGHATAPDDDRSLLCPRAGNFGFRARSKWHLLMSFRESDGFCTLAYSGFIRVQIWELYLRLWVFDISSLLCSSVQLFTGT